MYWSRGALEATSTAADSALAASGAARALPARGDGAGVSGHHHGVQRADVDAQLQGVGRHHGAYAAVAQPPLDLAALARQVAAAISAHRFGGDAAAVAGVLEIGHQDLGSQAVVGENQGLQPPLDEFQRHAAGLRDVAAADAELAVDHRRIVENEILLAPRRAVALHQLKRTAGERFRQLPRVGDGGRAADELRPGAVETRRCASGGATGWPGGCRRRRGRNAARR